MTQPVHTPGPCRVYEPRPDEARILAGGDVKLQTGKVIATVREYESEDVVNARLLAAAYNAFDSAAKKLGVNAVLLAEAMQDGGIVELAICLNAL